MKAHLCPNLQNILERHAGICQFALEEHHDVVVVFLQLLAFRRLGVLCLTLLDIGLQLCDLLVDIRNVLFDDIGQFLEISSTFRYCGQNAWGHTLISTGLSSNKVFRFATATPRV